MMSTETTQLKKIFVVNGELLDAVRHLLSSGWQKKEDNVFYRNRNTYTIELDGKTHPMWTITVIGKNPEFDEHDWKLRQDLNRLRNLGRVSNKKLYLNDTNREEVSRMIMALKKNSFNLIYDNDYLIMRNRPGGIKIFKLAATLELVEQPDGWYVGEKRIL